MASWDDVRELALSLPETDEGMSRGLRQWRVREKLCVWERPLRRADREALGEEAPEGPILGARVEHPVAKEALLKTATSSSRRRTSTATRPCSYDLTGSRSRSSTRWLSRHDSRGHHDALLRA